MSAYYNENEPFVVEWLRRLILFDHIAPGDVDARSIRDVAADDLKGYDQCHFFAGIGIWSLALRWAGWADDRPVWTGSCPCQPFSAAGQRRGESDDRHLWPEWFRLIGERRPECVFGEQVASKDGLNWFDLVSTDLERTGYAVGAHDLCAAGIGAPHIRQRLWFVANRSGDECQSRRSSESDGGPQQSSGCGENGNVVNTAREQKGLSRRAWEPGEPLAHHHHPRLEGRRCEVMPERSDECPVGASGDAGSLQHTESDGRKQWRSEPSGWGALGFWREADWIECRDGKRRPVEPATFPLAHGYPARVGRLRAYGNAICPQIAATFIAAAMECMP